jgi:putative membrane protein
MKHILNEDERIRLESLIEDAEEKTGAQIVMALIRRCDQYPEVPWRAFALGSSVAALVSLPALLLSGTWITDLNFIIAISAIMASGALLAILPVFLPGFARLFVSKARMEAESLQYADSLFLEKEIFTAEGRRGVLLAAFLFERRVVILPDKGLDSLLNKDQLDPIILHMSGFLKRKKIADAMMEGLEKIVAAIGPNMKNDDTGVDLPDNIIEEEGV